VGSQDLQQARYDQLVRRVGALYGGGSKVTEVLPELFPVLEVENTTPELIALTGWRTAWQSTERPAVVAQVSKSQLFNPSSSGVIAAVTKLLVVADSLAITQVQIENVQIGTPVKGLFRDGRFGVPRNTVLEVSSIDNVATGGGLRFTHLTDTPIQISDDNGIVVLVPGTGLSVGTTNVNVRLTVNYFWRERLAQESEINFP